MSRVEIAFRVGGALLVGTVSRATAQESAFEPFRDAGPAIATWLDHVRGGAGGATWGEASGRFQYRVGDRTWSNWVERSAEHLRELRPRRVVQSAFGRDSAPLEPVDWVRVLFASDRPAGGKIMEQVMAVREPDSVWRVADYSAWPDPEAIVNNAALDPVPYAYGYWPRVFVHGWRRVLRAPASREPDRARALPRRPPR